MARWKETWKGVLSPYPQGYDSEVERNKARNRDNELAFYRERSQPQRVADFHAPKHEQTPIADHFSQTTARRTNQSPKRAQTYEYRTPSAMTQLPQPANGRPHDFASVRLESESIRRGDESAEESLKPLPLTPARRQVPINPALQLGTSTMTTQARIVPAREQQYESLYATSGMNDNSVQSVPQAREPESRHGHPSMSNERAQSDLDGRLESNKLTKSQHDALSSAEDPRPAKDSFPSRRSMLSPRQLKEAVGSRLRHRRQKSELEHSQLSAAGDDSNGVQPHEAEGLSMETASVQGVVNGGITPQASYASMSIPENPENSYKRLHKATLSRHAPVEDPATTFEVQSSGAVSAAATTPQLQIASPTDPLPRSFLDLSTGGDDNLPEMEADIGEDNGKVDPSNARASHDLFMLYVMLKDFAPEDPDLARCKSAEKAAEVIRSLYNDARDGWRKEYNRAQRLDRIVGDVEQLKRRNAELENRNETLELKEELYTQHKKANIEYEARIASIKDECQFVLDKERRSYETTIGNDRKQFNHTIAELNRECSALRSGHDILRQTTNDCQLEAERQRQEARRLDELVRSKIASAEIEARRHGQDREKLVSEHREAIAAQEIMHANDTKALHARVRKLEEDIKDLNTVHEGQLSSLGRDHDEAVRVLERNHRNALDQKDIEKRDAETYLKDFYRGEMAKKDQGLQRQLESHAAQREDQVARHNAELSNLQDEIDELRADAHKVEDRVRQEYLNHEQKLRAKHQAQIREVTQQKEDLVGALVERDSFKGMTDRTLETRYKKLAKAVDQFSRNCSNWDKNKETRWPLSSRTVHSQENPRQVKQFFVQNMIWTTLYDNIFQTPFSSFGIDGDNYHRTWVDTFGGEDSTSSTAPHWPQAGKKCEEWRWSTIERCLETIERASGDPILNRAYTSGIENICDDLCRNLDRIIANTGSLQKGIKEIVQQATRLWLDLGIQRCRFLIVVPPISRGASKRLGGSLQRDWVVQPEVQRIGNAQGEHLDTQETVVCKMEMYKLGQA